MRARQRDKTPSNKASRSDSVSETVRLAFGRVAGRLVLPYWSGSPRRNAVVYITGVSATAMKQAEKFASP